MDPEKKNTVFLHYSQTLLTQSVWRIHFNFTTNQFNSDIIHKVLAQTLQIKSSILQDTPRFRHKLKSRLSSLL